MEEEATASNAPNGELRILLEDPYESDYLSHVHTEPNTASNADKSNPWVEPPQRVDRRNLARIQAQNKTSSLQNDFHEAELSLANPNIYTPCHPSRIPKPSVFRRASNRGRTSAVRPTLQPKNEPIVAHQTRYPISSIQGRLSTPSTIMQPPILRPPTTSQSIDRMPYANHGLPPIPVSKVPHVYQFASAPTFTRFSNGNPHTQVVNNFSQQYMPLPQPAHSASNVSTTLPDINCPSMNKPLPEPLPNSSLGLPASSLIRPQAQPVMPALNDFIKHLSDTSGYDYNALLQQVSIGANDSILLNVPPALDKPTFRDQISQAQAYILAQAQQYPLTNGQHQYQLENQLQRFPRFPRFPPPAMHSLPPFGAHSLGYSPTGLLDSLRYPLPPSYSAYRDSAPPKPKPTHDEMEQQDKNVDADGDDEYHEVETYADYVPDKLQLGKPHPDPVVETSSLSTVEPPDIYYKLKLPTKVIDEGLLSSLQLESVVYACQQHGDLMPDRKTRRGFLIGDGAGVGKGRTVAGIIYENWLCGRKKSIWLSVSTDLRLDAERDLRDIGAKIPVFLLNKFQYGRRINEDHGVIFSTYSGLVSKSQSVKGNYGSRMSQLVAWAGSSFDGVIVFDECHKAKNITLATSKAAKKLSKTAEYVLDIQAKLPLARIVYASATGASETRHLGYMTRLGIWGPETPYSTFADFCEAIERRGVGAMELVAVELKMRGSYIARQLSFKTTSFSIERAKLTDDFINLYDRCADMWALAYKHFSEAKTYFDKKQLRSMWPTFWAAHQRFFKYMCISAKVPIVVDIVERSLADGKCVVIGLQSTGEAKTLEFLDDSDISDFISTARATFESLVEDHFPAPKKGRRHRRASTSTDSDIGPLLAPSDNSGSTTSSSTIVDDQWITNEGCNFIVKDGMLLPKVCENLERRELAKSKQRAIQELIDAKKAQTKSERSLRRKRRLAMRQTDKSRIKKVLNNESDTDTSNLLSDNERLLSSSETMSGASDPEYEADTVTESEGTDDELTVIGTKSARKVKRNLIHDDSDDDIQITAVKTPTKPIVRPPVTEIVIESDEEEDDPLPYGQEMDSMKMYGQRLTQMQEELFAQIDAIGPSLPNNTLDDLIDRLGGPTKVAEMTGRKGRIVKDNRGRISYRQRNEIDTSETLNIEEKERFMNGDKLVAIISEAASSGISLQADRRAANTRRRVHITIELPWSADRAIQQFGRTHRSNQLSGPEYVFIISDLSGETRFASIVAKRLESLGALTHGDRRATSESRDLSQFNMNSRYCRKALERMNDILQYNQQSSDIKNTYKGNFIKDAKLAYIGVGLCSCYNNELIGLTFDPASLNVNIFLNRILGMKVHIQNAIFDLFVSITEKLISKDVIFKEYDRGILELNSESGKVRVEEPERFVIPTRTIPVRCVLRNIRSERGISWEEAQAKLADAAEADSRNGFYMSSGDGGIRAKTVVLAIREDVDKFRLYKPNVGRMQKLEIYSLVIGRYDKASEEAAKKTWTFIYQSTDTNCIHLCQFNNCKRLEANMKCDIGIRHKMYSILSGGILTVWPYLESRVPEATRKLKTVRLRLDDNTRIIGPSIPQDYLDIVRRALRDAETVGIDFGSKKKK